MKLLKVAVTGIAALLLIGKASAQTYIGSPITGTLPAGSYYNYNGIQLNPPFSFIASAGPKFAANRGEPGLPAVCK